MKRTALLILTLGSLAFAFNNCGTSGSGSNILPSTGSAYSPAGTTSPTGSTGNYQTAVFTASDGNTNSVNGALTSNAGDTIIYNWSFVGASTVTSSVTTNNPLPSCGFPNGAGSVMPWITPMGISNTVSGVVGSCQAGHHYIYTITAIGNYPDGSTQKQTLVVTVN